MAKQIKVLVLALLFVPAYVLAQSSDITFKGYLTKADTVTRASQLSVFFDKLKTLETDTAHQVVNILHVGDSHIQADILTAVIREAFQQRFGNAGRGLIFPLRVARTNGSASFRSTSASDWTSQSVRKRDRQFEPGISGISLMNDRGFNLGIELSDSDGAGGAAANSVELICRRDSIDPRFFLTDENNGRQYPFSQSDAACFRAVLPKPTDHFFISSDGGALLDGLVLANGRRGVRYHVTGINGAHFADFNASPVFFKEMKYLSPDLVIISLGTNEGANPHASADAVKAEVEELIANIRAQGIVAPVLLLTPFDNYYRRRHFNTHLAQVRQGIIEAAAEKGLPYLDMYHITGGYGSAAQWRAKGMLGADRVHYTVPGYQLQGRMIFEGLINSYESYAGH